MKKENIQLLVMWWPTWREWKNKHKNTPHLAFSSERGWWRIISHWAVSKKIVIGMKMKQKKKKNHQQPSESIPWAFFHTVHCSLIMRSLHKKNQKRKKKKVPLKPCSWWLWCVFIVIYGSHTRSLVFRTCLIAIISRAKKERYIPGVQDLSLHVSTVYI